MAFLWVNKTILSASLSHSEEAERLEILRQAQRHTRPVNRRRKTQESVTRTHGPKAAPRLPKIPPPVATQKFRFRELRTIAFFLNRTTSKVINLKRDHNFWLSRVPCMASENVIVYHLLAAIVSTHEFVSTDGGEASDRLALQECNKAITLLRTGSKATHEVLLISCILLAAFNLLRCEMTCTHAIVESGLKLAVSTGFLNDDEESVPESKREYGDLCMVLTDLKAKHGFKLWASDIAFRFERLDNSATPIVIEMMWTADNDRPETIEDIAEAYKNLMMNVIARILRNLARGAHIDPQCLLSNLVDEELRLLCFYAQLIRHGLSEEQKTVMKQLEIAITYATVLFHSKVCTLEERFFDEQDFDLCQQSLLLAEDVNRAIQNAGHPATYLERIVNGALFSFGLCSRYESIQQQAIALLQQQAIGPDAMLYWTRARVLKAINTIQDKALQGRMTVVWVIVLDMKYDDETGNLELRYALSDDDKIEYTFEDKLEATLPSRVEKKSVLCSRVLT